MGRYSMVQTAVGERYARLFLQTVQRSSAEALTKCAMRGETVPGFVLDDLSEMASMTVAPDERELLDAQDLEYAALLAGFHERYSIEFVTESVNVSIKCGVKRIGDAAYHCCTFFPSELKIYVQAICHYLCYGMVAANWLNCYEGRYATRSSFKDLTWF
jgi:hypothetical protein